MALLLLWEVDHGEPFVTGGGDGVTQRLEGFTKRLQSQVRKDSDLQSWLRWAVVNAPLMPGLAATHHTRWSVRVVAPNRGEPRGWYEEFTRRWRAYVETLVGPGGIAWTAHAAMDLESAGVSAMVRGRRSLEDPPLPTGKRQRPPSRPGVMEDAAMRVPGCSTSPTTRGSPDSGRTRPPAPTLEELPPKRHCGGDLRLWMVNPTMRTTSTSSTGGMEAVVGSPSGHGRATMGAPT